MTEQISYLEKYTAGLATMQGAVVKNYEKIREMDTKSQEMLKSVDEEAAAYLKDFQGMSKKEQNMRAKKVQKGYAQAMKLANTKAKLADKTYEMVDKHIQSFDKDIADLEAKIKGMSTPAGAGAIKKKGQKSTVMKKIGNAVSIKKDVPQSALKKFKKAQSKASASFGATSLDFDVPVDPNEPTYCVCNQVSYGEMIACDNPDCEIEWFHFDCVKLSSKPKGKWFCSACKSSKPKK